MNRNKNFEPFNRARDFVRSLNLQSSCEWNNYRKNRPKGIPCNPSSVYKNKGWVSWSHFFGKNGRNYKSIV